MSRSYLARLLYINLNYTVFDGKLPECEIQVDKELMQLAEKFIGYKCMGVYSSGTIYINPNIPKWQDEYVLLHEMIHMWQDIHGYKLNHGKRLKKFAKKACKQLQIDIQYVL